MSRRKEPAEAAPSEHPCKAVHGNTWYQWGYAGHTIGVSVRKKGRGLRLRVEENDTQITLTVCDEAGEPLLDQEWTAKAGEPIILSSISITKP